MKIEWREGTMKFRESEEGCSVPTYWELALALYEKATYVNDIDIIINPDSPTPKKLSYRWKG